MARQGGSYVKRNGKTELTHRTKPGGAAAPTAQPAAAPAPQPTQAPATPEKPQKTGKVKEADNG
ncbi:hypothetical protein [Vreelandella venusta]|uniref:hypothetical protein n=1 Tax=Vreelandella venusta TaxID=44935 RepID=UPI00200DBA01|nr:hypothetical protein [Halomonas venusta]UQI41934.1 hypothetical protein M3L73_06650 [Halomonas venusta]